MALAFIASVSANPAKFQHPATLKSLLRLLRSSFQQGRERSGSFEKKSSKPKPPKEVKSTQNISLAILVANLLAKILKSASKEIWPDDCIKVFVDDSLQTRAWVDHEMCSPFVDMIKNHIDQNPVTEGSQRIIEHLSSKVTEIKKGGANPTGFKNVMLTLSDLTPLPQGRLIASSNLDLWFQSTSHKTIARDLLLKIARSCSTMQSHDLETVENLLNMKFKSVSFPQLKTEVFTLLVRQRPEYINIAIKVILQKERLAATLKDVDNLKMMPLIFRETTSPVKDLEDKDDSVFKRVSQQHPGFETSKALGAVLQEMAMISSNLPTLKNTLRKVIRSLGQDQLDLRGLCQGLMIIPKTQQSLEFFVMMGELVALSLFVQGAAVRSFQVNFQEPVVTSRSNLLPKAIDKGPRRLNNQNLLNPSWNPSANASGDASQKRLAKEVKEKAVVTPAIKAREELTQLIAEVQRMAINWCHELQQLGEQLGLRLFGAVIRKIMFIDMLADMQPTDHDRGCFNFCKDMLPLHETTIVGIVGMCYYASPEETLEILKILETVVIRAGEGHIIRETYFETQEQIQEYQNNGGLMGLRLDRLDFSLHLLEAGVVRGHSYDGKSVCYAELYWLSCCVLLILVSFNPSTLGASVWESIPTMRSLMQMAITGRYTFPPVGPEDAKLFEVYPSSISLVESNQILAERERTFLQAHQLPVDYSLMVAQPPQSTARTPPLEILRKVEGLDKGLRLGLRLRKSRVKDFLMDMVDVAVSDNVPQSRWSEGQENIWWIVEIVCEEYETLSYLPRRCLCELLLLACVDGEGEKSKYLHAMLLQQVPRLLQRLKECMEQNDIDVITFFLDRLISPNIPTRRLSSYLLELLTSETIPTTLVNPIPAMKFDWLPALVRLPCFPKLHLRIIASLENILKHETSVSTLKQCLSALYDLFSHQPKLQLQLAEAIGALLVQRTSVARLLLTDSVIFSRMVDTFWAAVETQKNEENATNIPREWITFDFDDGHGKPCSIALPVQVVSGVVELLSFPSPTPNNVHVSFDKLVSFFFPANSQFGLLHSGQTYVCSPERLFRLACVSHEQLMNSAIRNMPLEVLWRLLLSYGRVPSCLSALLKALQSEIVSRPDDCLSTLVKECVMHESTSACEMTILHMEMYMRQSSFLAIKNDGNCLAVMSWLRHQLTSEESEHIESGKANDFLKIGDYLPLSEVNGWEDNNHHFATLDLPHRIVKQHTANCHDTARETSREKESDSVYSCTIPSIRLLALGDSKPLAKMGTILSSSTNTKHISVCLNELLHHGVSDNIVAFFKAFLCHRDSISLLPFSTQLLESIWSLFPWHVRGVWSKIVRLIVVEQTMQFSRTRQVDSARISLIRNISGGIPNNLSATITALYDYELMSLGQAQIEREVVQSIVMDIYLSRPHTFALYMDLCAPGWQSGTKFIAKNLSKLESKIDQLLNSKDNTDSLRLLALRHPILVASRVLNFALHLTSKPGSFLTQVSLENWLVAMDFVKTKIMIQRDALRQVMQCLLHLLEHGHDKGKTPTGLHIFRLIEFMVRQNASSMGIYFTDTSYRLLWSHALANYDLSNTHVAFVAHYLDFQTIKNLETPSWSLSFDSSQEDQLEQLKNTMHNYFGFEKSLILPQVVAFIQTGSLSKKTVVLLCQCLLLILHADTSCALVATEAYMMCLMSAKIGLREAATSFLPEFLVYCSPRQHYDILAHLFMDDSDVAKSSLSQHFKSELFKLTLSN
ncbi:Integrator complex subunit 1 [Aphanomyces cochlioides]|nr:Integrator complex subunit 1 [Aphanomyces cochlioides]